MLKRSFVAAVALLAAGVAPAFAQSSPRVEVSGILGWTFSDGVSGTAVKAGDGNTYNRIDPKDSGSFGFSVGVLANDNAEVGFMYSHQYSTLVLGGTADREVGNLGINSYHGYFGYNFLESDSKLRPFIYGGLGASNFSSVEATVSGVNRTIAGSTKFSTTWGGGVKYFVNPKVGVRFVASWTPTYIKTDATGWWCDPYWGCYLTGNPQYANQLTLAGGVTLRF
jgi:outer membrane protein W